MTYQRVPPKGPARPEVYLTLLLFTRQPWGMEMVEDASGQMIFVSTRTRQTVPLDLDCYEELASRGWVEADADKVTISEQGMYGLGKYLKANKLVMGESPA